MWTEPLRGDKRAAPPMVCVKVRAISPAAHKITRERAHSRLLRTATSYDCAMERPGTTRYRRPFLAPLWLTLLVAVLGCGVLFAAWHGATTTMVVLARPVEKDPGTIDDPPLSAEGEERAQRLAQMFGVTLRAGPVDGLYVSDERRAQQTAAPLAERLHRTAVVFSAADARNATARALREHSGGTVLVVGSGATLQQALRGLGVEDLAITPGEETDIIYLVSIPSFGHAHVLRLKY
jgi:Histidine phosphatase superfamily (branch 1)